MLCGLSRVVADHSSLNCQRELATARRCGLPLILVHESDETKNGMPLPSLRHAASQRLSARDTECLFDDGRIIPWHRVADFQQVSVAAIAEEVLLASPAYANASALPLHVDGGLAWSQPIFGTPRPTVYVSPNNPAAADVAEEMHSAFGELRPAKERLPQALEGLPRPHWLVALSPSCFQGALGDLLRTELMDALRMDADAPIVMVFAPEKHAFDAILRASPQELIGAGLFGRLAIEWREGIHHPVSLRLVARALGATLGVHPWESCARPLACSVASLPSLPSLREACKQCAAAWCAGPLVSSRRARVGGSLVESGADRLSDRALELAVRGASRASDG